MTKSDDMTLMRAWQDGDPDAGEQLLARHFQALYRFFRNKVGEEADDLIQQTFLALVRGRDGFRGHASFRTYLFVIARHELYRHVSEHARDRARFDPEHTTLQAALPSPSSNAAAREFKDIVHAALRRVPMAMQVALELHYWEDLSVRELAESLEVAEGTVKRRLQRGRQALDKEIRRALRDAGLTGDRREIERALGFTRNEPEDPDV